MKSLKNQNFIITVIMLCGVFAMRGQNDCIDAIVVCGNTGFGGLTATGVGIQELSPLSVCSSEENNSIWLKLSIETSGTLAFTLTPESDDINEDFDFWLFGPNVTCGAIGTAIRCSTTNPALSGAVDNLTGMSDFEIDFSEGAGPDGNNYVQAVSVNAGDSYFLVIDRPVGFSDFSLEWTGTASFSQQPTVPNTNLDMQKCDFDLIPDGFTAFNLTLNDAAVIATQTGIAVTYHISSNDAIIGANPITNPIQFTNTQNPQIIFVRVTNIATGCFNYRDFSIAVNNTVAFSDDSFTTCDDGSDGDSNNGKTDFDLNEVTATVFAGQDISGYTIGYYLSQINAVTDVSPIFLNYYNTNPDNQSIFIKITTVGGCFSIKEIFLHVTGQILVNASLTQCDTELVSDGLTQFNLNEALPEITGGNPNLVVAFFESGNPVPLGFNYTNLSNPQILEISVTNLLTGCIGNASLTLNVNVVSAQTVTIQARCDNPAVENGIAIFDLNDSAFILTATQTSAFYENINDALLEQNQIANTSSYSNLTPYHSTIYVRIEDSNLCASISPLELTVNKLPHAVASSGDYFVCPQNPENYVTLDAAITDGLPGDYFYQWFRDGNQVSQTSYEIDVNQAGVYTVEISALGCSTTRTITVLNSDIPVIESILVNDFTTEVNTVQVNLSASGTGDYVFSLDNPNGPFQESGFFGNVATGLHELYIKDLKACGIIGPVSINVLGIPKYFTPNGDGYNDLWNIRGANAEFHKHSTISIFDRHGKFLKQISAVGFGWDGICNNKPLPAEDYWYHITLEDGRSAKGHFTLKR